MIKFLIYLGLMLGLQLASAQKENVFYKTEEGKIITKKQLDERIERLKKVAQQISKEAKVNTVLPVVHFK